jgi:hypothetical protein
MEGLVTVGVRKEVGEAPKMSIVNVLIDCQTGQLPRHG